MANKPSSSQLLPVFNKGLSKTEITSLVAKSIEKVIENGNVLEIAEVLTVMDEFISRFRKDSIFISSVRDELEKYKGKFQSSSGSKIENCEAATRYDFSTDGTWKNINERIEELTQQKKSREDKLKRIQPGKMIVDAETGEVLQGPSKTSVSTYKIYLPK